MRNFKILLSYDGTDFAGWQTQPGQRTVQEVLQTALHTLTGGPVRVTASGRTDSGVHAVGQVAHFLSETRLPAGRMAAALNSQLPHDVAVLACDEMPLGFDANRDAVRKLYRYVIHDGQVVGPFLRRYCCHVKYPVDVAAMARAGAVLKGTHDFQSFETEWPNRASSVRTITHLGVSRAGEYVWLDVEADGFLYNMVRAIAGTLLNVGRGFWPEREVEAILHARDRRRAGPTAPAQGLFLMRVQYASSGS